MHCLRRHPHYICHAFFAVLAEQQKQRLPFAISQRLLTPRGQHTQTQTEPIDERADGTQSFIQGVAVLCGVTSRVIF